MKSAIKKESVYISNREYIDIRNDLCSKNGEIIKMALQCLITRFESGRTLNKSCSKDLCALLHNIVKNPDQKIRKWAYHLVAYNNSPSLINQCIYNLKTGFEKDKENITWVLSLASMQSPKENVWELYKQYGDEQISYEAYTVCSNLFTREKIAVNPSTVKKIVDRDDFLSKMWLTKAYACKYRSDKQKEVLQAVDHNVMNTLLQDDETQRYALWAFSAKKNVDLSKISIAPYDYDRLPPKSQAWYCTCLFKDENYVTKNQDHVLEILDDFFYYPQVIRLGILRGLEAAPYELDYLIPPLIHIYCKLDENNTEHLPLLISLTQIMVHHVEEDKDIQELLIDLIQYTQLDKIRRLVLFMTDYQKGDGTMIVNINAPGANVQNIERANTVNQIRTQYIMDNAHNLIVVDNELKEILNRVKSGEFDSIFETQSEEIENFAANVQFSCQNAKGMVTDPNDQKVVDALRKIDNTAKELSKTSKKERKIKITDIISCISGLCTIAASSPEIWGFLQETFNFIKTLLGIM